MRRKANVKLLAALESKNGQKWCAFYEDNTFAQPSYYCTLHDNGEHLGNDLKTAAARVVALAAAVKPKLYRLELTPEVLTRYA